MIKIFLCDDEAAILNRIKELIEKEIIIHAYDFCLDGSFDSPVALLEKIRTCKDRRNIYFLDVELKHPEYDGFLLGKEIRSIDPNATIVYITSFKDLAYKTFQYHIEAFDYIVKDEDKLKDSISECLQSITLRLQEERKDPVECYTFRSGDMIRHIPIDDILFFETSSRSHFVILHGLHQRIEFIGNLSDIEKELGKNFLKIHRSYLIAINKIDHIDLKRNIVRIGNSECAISRRMKSELLKRVNQ